MGRRCAMKATDLLKRQHREVKGLFKKIEDTENSSERRKLMTTIAQELKVHTTIEEEIFYPAMREVQSKKAEQMVNEAYEEHHVVDLVLRELPQVDPEDERFEAKMTVLSELVQHHIEEEEDEMFKLAAKLDKEELDELGKQMNVRATELKGMTRQAA